jgi:hypothetical protein
VVDGVVDRIVNQACGGGAIALAGGSRVGQASWQPASLRAWSHPKRTPHGLFELESLARGEVEGAHASLADGVLTHVEPAAKANGAGAVDKPCKAGLAKAAVGRMKEARLDGAVRLHHGRNPGSVAPNLRVRPPVMMSRVVGDDPA